MHACNKQAGTQRCRQSPPIVQEEEGGYERHHQRALPRHVSQERPHLQAARSKVGGKNAASCDIPAACTAGSEAGCATRELCAADNKPSKPRLGSKQKKLTCSKNTREAKVSMLATNATGSRECGSRFAGMPAPAGGRWLHETTCPPALHGLPRVYAASPSCNASS